VSWGSPSFGQELRARRIRARLTQQELADLAGVSVRAVRYIEHGEVRRPRRDSVRRLGAAVGLLPDGESPVHGPPGLWIGVLGALEVTSAGRPVDGGTLKQRSLLGLLALRPNEVVPRAEIVALLWGSAPPESCQNLVHTYASRLRKVISAEVIATQGGGYRLAVGEDQLDLVRFDEQAGLARQVQQRDPGKAMQLYEQALRFWRGPLLADLPDELRRHPAALATSARRVSTALEYADLALRRGVAGGHVVDQLRLLAEQEPLHEGLHARLMLALAGSGQQAAALRLFAGVRRRLADELGVEPGAELRAAHLRIIRAGRGSRPELPARDTQVPAELPADAAGFSGRAADLARLDALLPSAGGRRDTAVVISAIAGTAGVGKTALAVHWAHRIRNRFPDGQLYLNLRGYAAGSPVAPHEGLTRFLRALGVAPEAVPVDEEEAANLYRTRLADKRVLILLDNAASADQVRPLLPGSPGCLVVVTSRDRLTGLVAKEGAHRLALDVLEAADARSLLAAMLGAERVAAQPEAVAQLGRMCAHLPLALRIAAANLTAAPDRSIADYVFELRAHGRLLELTTDDGDAVRAAFDLSFARLEPAARRLFPLLGLVPGPDVTPAAAAALTGGATTDARRDLETLAAAHLVAQHAAGRYQCHDLLRAYAEDLATQGDPAGPVARLLDYYLRTADAATRLLYPHVLRLPRTHDPAPLPGEQAAITWLESERANLVAAAVRAADLGMPDYAWRIADALRGWFVHRGHGADGLAVCNAALTAARAAGDEEGEASAHDVLGLIHYNLGDFHQAVTCHTTALAAAKRIGNAVAEANSLHNLGRAHSHLGQPEHAATRHEQALELNRLIGNRHGEAIALNYIGGSALVLGQSGTARSYTRRALELSRELGDRYVEAQSLNSLGIVHWAAGQYSAADTYFVDALRISRELGFSYGEASVLIGLSRVRRCTGRSAEAIECCRDALNLMRDRGIRLFEGRALAELAYSHLELGELEAAAAHAGQALEVARQRRQRLIEARALHVLGLARRATGDVSAAHADWRAALEIFTEIGAPEKHAVRALL
jgi:DNA-binding SARP family transcriptional activator